MSSSTWADIGEELVLEDVTSEEPVILTYLPIDTASALIVIADARELARDRSNFNRHSADGHRGNRIDGDRPFVYRKRADCRECSHGRVAGKRGLQLLKSGRRRSHQSARRCQRCAGTGKVKVARSKEPEFVLYDGATHGS